MFAVLINQDELSSAKLDLMSTPIARSFHEVSLIVVSIVLTLEFQLFGTIVRSNSKGKSRLDHNWYPGLDVCVFSSIGSGVAVKTLVNSSRRMGILDRDPPHR